MHLEHVFDLDLRYEGKYTVVRPYGETGGFGYAVGGGRASEPVAGTVRFSNNPRVRGDGHLLPDLSGSIALDVGGDVVFNMQGLGMKREREFVALLGAIFESDTEGCRWLNDCFCLAEATVRGRSVTMRVYRCDPD